MNPVPAAPSAFIFDIGNVLLRFDFNVALQKLARDSGPAAHAISELIEPVKAVYEGGKISRGQFQDEVRQILCYTGSDEDFIAAWEDIFTENEPMIRVVEQLHGKYPLYLLSNTSDIHIDFVRRQYPWFSRFTDAVYSYKVCASKPEREIYEIAIRQFGVEPGRTLFIDDLLPNIEAARATGLLAHHYHHDRHTLFLDEMRGMKVPV